MCQLLGDFVLETPYRPIPHFPPVTQSWRRDWVKCMSDNTWNNTGNESVPIQLAQCWFPGLAISSAEILMRFSNKIYGRNFIEQHSETVVV